MRAEVYAMGAATRIEGPLLFLKRTVDVGLNEAVEYHVALQHTLRDIEQEIGTHVRRKSRRTVECQQHVVGELSQNRAAGR